MCKVIDLASYKESKKIQLTLKQAQLIVSFISNSVEEIETNVTEEELIERAYQIVYR